MKPCPEPRCPNLTTGGPCPQHARAREQRRGSSDARGYTYRWSKRAAAFKARYPLCGMRPGGRAPVMSRCFDEGRTTAVFQVDHVVPHRGDQALFWDEEGNWQALCASCGAAKSAAGL